MKLKTVRFEKLVSLGNYEHEKIAIELEAEEGDTYKDMIQKAKEQVSKSLGGDNEKKEIESQRTKMDYILANPHVYNHSVYINAKKWIEDNPIDKEALDDELPPF